MLQEKDLYHIGKLTKTHGVKGEMLLVFTDDVWKKVDTDHIFLRIDGTFVPFFIAKTNPNSVGINSNRVVISPKPVVINSNGVVNTTPVEDMRELVGTEVFIERSLLPKDHELMHTWDDFIGMTVNCIGTITDVYDNTDNILFNVSDSNGTSHLIPAAEDLVEDIDWDARTITMCIPEGLLDI